MKRVGANRRGWVPFAALLLVSPLGARADEVATPPAGVERWIVPGGREADVLALLAPLALLQPTKAGPLLKDARVEGATVTLTVVPQVGADVIGHVTLRRTGADTLEVLGEGVPEALVAEVRAAVTAKPVESWPFVRPPSALVRPGSTGHSGSDDRSPWPLLLPALLLLGLLLSTGLAIRAAVQAGSGPARFEAVALLVITIGGGWLRLVISPRHFMHEYYHIVDFMHDALFRDDGYFHYGGGGPVLFRISQFLFGGVEESVFRVNLLLSTLTVPVVGAFVGALAGWPAALLAAGLVAVAPMHLRFSGSEDLTIAGTLWAAWGLAAATAWWRSGRRSWLVVTVLALSMGLHTRPELLVFPGFLLGLLLVDRTHWKRLWSIDVVIAGLLLLLFAFPRIVFLLESPASEKSLSLAMQAFYSRFALIDFDALPAHWIVLVFLGVAGWIRSRRPGVVLWAAGSAVALALLGLSFFQNPAPYSWRVQLVTLPFLALLAVGTLQWLPEKGSMRRAAALAFTLVATAGVVLRPGPVTRLGDQQLEFAFVKSMVPKLASPAKLLAVREQTMKSLDAFPIFLLEDEKKVIDVVDLDKLAAGDAWPSPEGETPLLYYEGMPCHFAFWDEPLPLPIHARCEAVRKRYLLEPIETLELDVPGYSPMFYGPGPWTIGFYRLRRQPEPAPEAVPTPVLGPAPAP